MNKLDLAARLAKESHRSRAKAADKVDKLVYRLLKDLKRANNTGDKSSGPVKETK